MAQEKLKYNFFGDNFFTVFKDIRNKKVELDYPLGGKKDITSWAKEILYNDEGFPTIIVNSNIDSPKQEDNSSDIIDDNNPEVEINPQELQTQQQKVHTTKSKPTKSEREYVEQYADYAMDQMKKYGIPASITLAQGLIETNHGTSRLSRVANNHFGIKGTYNGNFVLANDDKPNEKFRKYDDPLQSFEDHSKLLRGNRYQVNVGNLALDDYKGWAKGIKKSGYATAPNYAQSLIDVIERNGLQKYDKLVLEQKNV